MNRPGSDGFRRAMIRSILSGWLSVAPSEGRPGGMLPGERPAVVLAVGEPMPSLAYRAAAGGRT